MTEQPVLVAPVDPELQAAIDEIAAQLGFAPKRRCSMPESTRASMCIWRHQPVTCCIRGSLNGVSEARVKEIYQHAIATWNACCDIGAAWTDDFNHANIYANCGPIDGASGTLAWSYLVPCGGASENIRIEQLYDNKEGWTENWLLEVMLHELGHAFGLDHINTAQALMYPYSAGGSTLAPTKYEAAIMVPKYGEPVETTDETMPPITGGTLLILDQFVPLIEDRFTYAGKSYRVEVHEV